MNTVPVLFYEPGTCALGSLIALEALGQPYWLCRLESNDLEDETFLALNPLGEVPTLLTENGVITESLAVLHHIGSKGLADQLSFEQGTPPFDQLNRALAYLVSSFHKAFSPNFAAGLYHPDAKIQAEIKKTVLDGNLKSQLKHVEEHLLNNEALFHHLTIASAYLFGTARWAKDLYDLEQDFPKIDQFLDRMSRMPAVGAALAIEDGRVQTAKGAFQGHLELNSIQEPSTSGSFPGLQTTPHDKASPTRRSGAV